jgi:hypothetical protein
VASGGTLICGAAVVVEGGNWRGYCVHIPPTVESLAMVKSSIIINIQSVFHGSSAMQMSPSPVALGSRPRTAEASRAAIDAQLHFWLDATRCERSRQGVDSHSTSTGTCFSTGGCAAIAHAAPVAQKLAGSSTLLFHRLQEGSPSSLSRRDRVCSVWF